MMTNKKTLTLVFFFAFVYSIQAQRVPGYLGNKNLIEGGINALPLALIGTQYNSPSLKPAIEFRYQRVVSSTAALSFGYNHLSTKFSNSDNVQLFSPYGTFKCVANRFSFGVSRINKRSGGISPLGKQWRFEIFLQSESAKNLDQIVPDKSNPMVKLDTIKDKQGMRFGSQPGFSISYQIRKIISGKVFINYGIGLNVVIPVKSYNYNKTLYDDNRFKTHELLDVNGLITFNIAFGFIY